METAQILGQADKRPLQGSFCLASQTKSAEPHGLFDNPKDGLNGLLPLFVFFPALFGGGSMGYFLGEVGLLAQGWRIFFLFQILHPAMMVCGQPSACCCFYPNITQNKRVM